MSTTFPAIVLATHNRNKAQEFREMLSDKYQVLTMGDVGFKEDVAETEDTFAGNALIKAMALCKFLQERDRHYIVVADDSGLCVEALNGRPGVYSARYGGDGCDDHTRCQLVLQEMDGVAKRRAIFTCALVCIVDIRHPAEYSLFVGNTTGSIATKECGAHGFAYDPIFISDELGKTFAEATTEMKDAVSHRGDAIRQLREYLETAFG